MLTANVRGSQMTSFVTLGPLDTSQFADALLAVLRLQLPSSKSTPGFCVTHTLTATSKVALEVALQLSVGVGMVVVFALGAAGTAVLIMLPHISACEPFCKMPLLSSVARRTCRGWPRDMLPETRHLRVVVLGLLSSSGSRGVLRLRPVRRGSTLLHCPAGRVLQSRQQ
jgi:hypothetical protein